MEDQTNRESFQYVYSAKEQKEIQDIRQKYAPKASADDSQEDKMALLRKLDRNVTSKGTAAALTTGVIGTLLMGFGMSCVLVWMGDWFIPGILLGILGIGIAALSYPLYTRITQKERERLAPEILRLTDELLK